MKVILNTDIPNLGEEGDILNVSPGYARNYLLPKGLVSMYNKTNLSILDGKKKAIEKRREEKRQHALSLKEKIKTGRVEFAMPAGDNGKLFGAVTAQMIVDALSEQGMEVERKKIDIPGHTIKAVGNYKIRVRLYGEEEAELPIEVKPEGASAGTGKEQAASKSAAKPAEAPAAVAEQAPAEEADTEEPAAPAAEAPSTDDEAVSAE